ncbi:MAG: N-acetyl-1-D-myo-inositol-2-amino-2-deoxy-alpha-D-glucopyranoside deacetylase [Candidatus Corynebacterium faecigallinarum]
MNDLQDVRILAVHAHPDDESLWTGLSLAQWARRGAEVTVVTCTLGEEGEVIGEKYAGLVADDHDILGGYRIAELQRALGELGVGRPRFLGGPGRWRDSGMAGAPAAEHPAAFVSSGATAVEQLTAVFDDLRPHVVVTYGPDGGYGHPDHIRAYEIVHAAADAAAESHDAHWTPARIYWAVQERERVEAGLAAMRDAGDPPAGWRWPEPGELASVPAASVDVRVVAGAYPDDGGGDGGKAGNSDLDAKRRAMTAHATQLWVADGSASDVNDRAREPVGDGVPMAYCLSNLIAQPLLPSESYMIGAAFPVPRLSQDTLNRLDCLFAEGR